jgi:endonuclease YncB( thermonuclease family)
MRDAIRAGTAQYHGEYRDRAAAKAKVEAEIEPVTITGKVVEIIDGDTLILHWHELMLKVRLGGINAPEEGQEGSIESKKALSDLTAGKTVTFQVSEDFNAAWIKSYIDPRLHVGTVFVGDQNVNLALVRAGNAWATYGGVAEDVLRAAMETARVEDRGIWSGYNYSTTGNLPISPGDYRNGKRKPQPAISYHWLNSSSGVRHNASCRWYSNTVRGRSCGSGEGSACGICGG